MSSLGSYQPLEAHRAEKLVQSLHSPAALMQSGNQPPPSLNQAYNQLEGGTAHNILLQQLSQYAAPLSYREEVESYSPPPMAADVIQTLLDKTIKNKKECIQRICAGQRDAG